MVRSVNFSTKDVQILPEDARKGASLKLPSDVSKLPDGKLVIPLWERVRLSELLVDVLTDDQLLALQEALKIKDVVTTKTTLSNIEVGAIEDDQRSRLRAALQLVSESEVSKGWLKDDRTRLCYWSGSLYGVKRVKQSDITSTNERTDAATTNTYRALNGEGSTGFDSASNQWLTYFFNAKNVFKIVLRYQNDNWAVRTLVIGSSRKALTSGSGDYSYTWTPASGWQSTGKTQIVDDGGRGRIQDFQILYADPNSPTLLNGETLASGDFFKVENTQQLLRFDGVDSASGAWKAVPVTSSDKLDVALDPISTNGVENKAIYWGLENLKTLLTEKIDNQAIAEEISQFIDKQLLFNAISINRFQCLFESHEALKQELEALKKQTNA